MFYWKTLFKKLKSIIIQPQLTRRVIDEDEILRKEHMDTLAQEIRKRDLIENTKRAERIKKEQEEREALWKDPNFVNQQILNYKKMNVMVNGNIVGRVQAVGGFETLCKPEKSYCISLSRVQTIGDPLKKLETFEIIIYYREDHTDCVKYTFVEPSIEDRYFESMSIEGDGVAREILNIKYSDVLIEHTNIEQN